MVGPPALWAKAAADSPSGHCQVETRMQAGCRHTTTKGGAQKLTAPHRQASAQQRAAARQLGRAPPVSAVPAGRLAHLHREGGKGGGGEGGGRRGEVGSEMLNRMHTCPPR